METRQFGYDLAFARTPTISTPTTCKPMSKVTLLWQESVWPPASRDAKTTEESIKTKTESGAQREKELKRERKNKGNIFCWRKNMNFCSGGEKMRNASGHQNENERRKKKVNKNTYDISSINVSGSFTL